MLLGQRAVFFRDAGDVRAGVVNPHGLGRRPLREEDDVRLDPLTIRCEGAARQAEHGVQVAILGDDLEHFPRLIGEQAGASRRALSHRRLAG